VIFFTTRHSCCKKSFFTCQYETSVYTCLHWTVIVARPAHQTAALSPRIPGSARRHDCPGPNDSSWPMHNAQRAYFVKRCSIQSYAQGSVTVLDSLLSNCCAAATQGRLAHLIVPG
jgi:hypothetical protein